MLQSLALNNTTLSNAQKFHLHAIVASLLILIPNVVNIAPLSEYANKIIDARKMDAPHLLPDLHEHYSSECEVAKKVPHLLIDQMAVCECLKTGGLDPIRLQQTSPYGAGGTGIFITTHKHSWVETGARGSVVDTSNGPGDVDSISSSPGTTRKTLKEELTFECMKKILTDTNDNRREEEMERRQQLTEMFRTAPFNELIRRTQPKHEVLHNKLSEIFKSLSNSGDLPRNSTDPSKNTAIPIYEQQFPELFSY